MAKSAATTKSKERCRRLGRSFTAARGPLVTKANAPMTPPPAIRTNSGRPLTWMPTPKRAAAIVYSASWCPPKGTWRRDDLGDAIARRWAAERLSWE